MLPSAFSGLLYSFLSTRREVEDSKCYFCGIPKHRVQVFSRGSGGGCAGNSTEGEVEPENVTELLRSREQL